jgi:hypothetical protein
VLRGTLIEMKRASEPNNQADYWDLKTQIHQNLNDLTDVEKNLEKHVTKFNNCKQHGEKVVLEVSSAGRNLNSLKAMVERMQKVVSNVQALLTDFTQAT